MRRFTASVRSLLYANITFLALLAIAVVIRPEGLTANNGISYYGVFNTTVGFYTLAFLLYSFFMYRAARSLPDHQPAARTLYRVMILTSPLALGIAATPYVVNPLFDGLHVFFGSTLFVWELAAVMWFAHQTASPIDRTLAGIELASGVVCFLSILNLIGYQIEGQIVFQLTFSIFLIRRTILLEPTS